MIDRARFISKKNDHLSLVTGYTLLHMGSGYGIGAAAHALDLGAQAAALTVMASLLGWEVFEYWAAPAIGYWTVMNAGNTAMDIATGMWPFMIAAGWEWPSPWTYALILPGALLGHTFRCTPYEKPTRTLYTGGDRGCLMCMYSARKWLNVKGIKNFKDNPGLDPYMPPSRAHRWLAACSALFVPVAVFAPEQAVSGLAAFAFGYALAGPTEIAHERVYEDWYLPVQPEPVASAATGAQPAPKHERSGVYLLL
jgi:hypothetical protein